MAMDMEAMVIIGLLAYGITLCIYFVTAWKNAHAGYRDRLLLGLRAWRLGESWENACQRMSEGQQQRSRHAFRMMMETLAGMAALPQRAIVSRAVAKSQAARDVCEQYERDFWRYWAQIADRQLREEVERAWWFAWRIAHQYPQYMRFTVMFVAWWHARQALQENGNNSVRGAGAE